MPDLAERIAANVAAIRGEIAAACGRCGRDPASVTVVAVTKNQTPEVLPALRLAGIRDFGENRCDHFAEMLSAAQPDDHWHFIGRVQGRQLAKLAPQIAVLHSLCEVDHIGRLDRACAASGRRLPVLVQVNVSGEASKAGIAPADLNGFIAHVRAAGNLELAGVMTMAPDLKVGTDPGVVRACFAGLRTLATSVEVTGLSMGMSGDFALAIEEGATIVRIGSRLFA
jgi:pyridoxal phosphate enzyme (YggS family)